MEKEEGIKLDDVELEPSVTNKRERSSSKDSPAKPKKEHKSKKVRIMMPRFDTYLLTMEEFARDLTADISEKTIEKCFRKYKSEYIANDQQRFYELAKGSQWFELLRSPKALFRHAVEQSAYVRGRLTQLSEGFVSKSIPEINLIQPKKEGWRSVQFETQIRVPDGTETLTLRNPKFLIAPLTDFETPLKPLNLVFYDFAVPVAAAEHASFLEAFKTIPNFRYFDFINQFEPLGEEVFGFVCFDGPVAEGTLKSLGLRLDVDEASYSPSHCTYLDFEGYSLDKLEEDIRTMYWLTEELFEKFDVPFGDFGTALSEEPLEKVIHVLLFVLFYVLRVNYFHRTDIFNLKEFAIKNGIALFTSDLSGIVASEKEDIKAKLAAPLKDLLAGREPKRSYLFPKIYKWLDCQPRIERIADAEIDSELLKKFDKKESLWGCFLCEKVFKTDGYVLKHLVQRHEKEYLRSKEEFVENLTFDEFSHAPFSTVFCSFEKIHCHFVPFRPSEKDSKRKIDNPRHTPRSRYILDYSKI